MPLLRQRCSTSVTYYCITVFTTDVSTAPESDQPARCRLRVAAMARQRIPTGQGWKSRRDARPHPNSEGGLDHLTSGRAFRTDETTSRIA
jgi:hypothetical protein